MGLRAFIRNWRWEHNADINPLPSHVIIPFVYQGKPAWKCFCGEASGWTIEEAEQHLKAVIALEKINKRLRVRA